jgi:hypothetical protein
MKRLIQLLALAGIFLLLLGCTDLLSFNLFSLFDKPRVPSTEDLSTMEDEKLLNIVEDLVQSDSFYEDIAEEMATSEDGSSETKDAIVANLREIMDESTGDTTREAQRAALLVAEIELNSSPAGDVIDGFVTIAMGFIENPPDSSDTEQLAEDLAADVFSGISDRESFTAAINGLLAAGDAFTFYGESLDDTGTVVAPPEDNIGAIAQDAIVSLLVAEMFNSSTGLEVSDLEALVFDGTPLPPFTMDDDPFTTNTAMSNILEASGLGGLFDQEGAV